MDELRRHQIFPLTLWGNYVTSRQKQPPEVFYVKKVFLEISQNSQENTCAIVSFLIKLQAACNFIKKETLAQVFPVNVVKFLRTSFLHRTPLVAASVLDCHQHPHKSKVKIFI